MFLRWHFPTAVSAQTYYEGLRSGSGTERTAIVLDKDSVERLSVIGADFEFDLIALQAAPSPKHRNANISRFRYSAHCEQRYGVKQKSVWIDKDGSEFDPDFSPSAIQVGAKGTDTGKLFDAVCLGEWNSLKKLPSRRLLDLPKIVLGSDQ